MKKLIILIAFMLGAVFVYPQATPSNQIRVATATTVFGVNIPIGTTVYNVATDKYYVCKTATVSTLTLTTGSANFTQVGGAGLGGTVTNVSSNMYLNVATGTTTPHITPNVGIAKDSLVKMDSLATAGQYAKFGTKGLVGRSAAGMAGELGVKTAIVEVMEQGADSLSGHSFFTLAHTPVATSVSVKLNGMTLKPTTQYTIVGAKIRVGTSVYLYDTFSCAYSY